MASGEREAITDEWMRLPGLFYEEEIAPLLAEPEYRLELVTYNSIGLALFAVYHRLSTAAKETAQEHRRLGSGKRNGRPARRIWRHLRQARQ
jgi:hypothetical protein